MADPVVRDPWRLARPGAVLHGDVTGGGPTVLLLHAGAERRRVWTPVTDVLAGAGFRCVTVDQRGHGDSGGRAVAFAPYAADTAAMLDALPPRHVVVGASLGGLAALAALADPVRRGRAAGLVLVDVVPCPEPGQVRRFLDGAGLSAAYRSLAEDVFTWYPRLREVTATLDLPVLLVRGGDRSPLTDDDVARLHALAPHATVTRVPGTGHLVARDRPLALAEVLATAAAAMTAAR